LGIGAAIGPIFVAIASLLSPWGTGHAEFATNVALVGTSFVVINLWVTIPKPLLWRWRHGSMEGYRHVSVFPVIGTVLGITTCLIGFGHAVPALMALGIFLFDFGGSIVFVWATWRDRSFWDTPETSKVNRLPGND
jgi:hypothetical protein